VGENGGGRGGRRWGEEGVEILVWTSFRANSDPQDSWVSCGYRSAFISLAAKLLIIDHFRSRIQVAVQP
jgi:hypothetical protein